MFLFGIKSRRSRKADYIIIIKYHLHKEFKFPLEDCRFLGDPLDVLVFNGSAQNSVNHITFMEIKTGNAKLNPHQRMIRDAVNDQNVIVEQLE